MKIGMLCPGYGSQFVGMGKELYDDSRIMQEYFEEASNCLNMNFVKLCFASSDSELARMEYAYASLFLISSSIGALLKQEGINPTIVAGYNTGEHAAIYLADGFSFPDGLYLLVKYKTFYQEIIDTMNVKGLQVIGIPSRELQLLCDTQTQDNELVSIATYDSPIQHTIMGTAAGVEQVQAVLSQRDDVQIDEEPIEIGLHSSLMDSVALNLKIYLEKVDFKELTIPLITNADAKIIRQGDLVKSSLIKQIHSPILWYQSLELFNQCDVLVQVGPGSYLITMLQAHYPEKKCFSINKKADIEELKKYIEQNTIQQEESIQ